MYQQSASSLMLAKSIVTEHITQNLLVVYTDLCRRPSGGSGGGGGGGGGGNQAYKRLSTKHGQITEGKLDLVVGAGVCVVI